MNGLYALASVVLRSFGSPHHLGSRGHKQTAGGFNLGGEIAEWTTAERSQIEHARNRVMKRRGTRSPSRREFNERCVAFSSFVTLSGALAFDGATAVASTGAARTV